MSATPEILMPGAGRETGPSLAMAELDRIELRLERIARTLDSAVRIPGIGLRVGADSLLGLIPGIGDVIGLGLSGYLVLEARRLGAPASMLARMMVNVGLDATFGAVPLAGDVFDLFFKANLRNMKLLRGHIAELRGREMKTVGDSRRGLQA